MSDCEVPGSPGWFYSAITDRDGGVETEVYFHDPGSNHVYPGILVWAPTRRLLVGKAQEAIKHHLFERNQ